MKRLTGIFLLVVSMTMLTTLKAEAHQGGVRQHDSAGLMKHEQHHAALVNALETITIVGEGGERTAPVNGSGDSVVPFIPADSLSQLSVISLYHGNEALPERVAVSSAHNDYYVIALRRILR